MANETTFYEYKLSQESETTETNDPNKRPPSMTFFIKFTLCSLRRRYLYASSDDADDTTETEDILYGEEISKQIGLRCDLISPSRQANSIRSELSRMGISDPDCCESVVEQLCSFLSSAVENHRRSENPMRKVVRLCVVVNHVTVQGNKRRRGRLLNQFSSLEISKRRKPREMEEVL